MKKTIRTMQGKKLDFEKLILQNEKVTAVGNMHVNAAGEEIETAKKKFDRTRKGGKSYRRQINKRVFDLPVMSSKDEAELYAQQTAKKYIEEIKVSKEVEKSLNESDFIQTETQEPGKAVIQTAPPMSKPSTPQPRTEKSDEVSDELLKEVVNRPKVKGLAEALAKAQDVKQEPMKSPREQLRASDGVRKI